MIDQTALVQDTISLLSSFEVTSTTGRELDHFEEDSVLNFHWSLFDPSVHTMPSNAELIATCDGSHWVGCRIH